MSYAVDSDYWGFRDTNCEVQSSSRDPQPSEAQCEDSNGDVAASTMYDTVTAQSVVYQRCADGIVKFYDTTTGIDFRPGKVIGGYVITSIALGTNNKERPTITISGRSCPSADSAVNKYNPEDLHIATERKAVGIGVTPDTVSKLLSSSGTVAVQVAVVPDSDGNTACLDVYGGRVDASNELAGCTGDPGATVDTGWTTSGGPSDDQENTGYAGGTIGVFKNLAQM